MASKKRTPRENGARTASRLETRLLLAPVLVILSDVPGECGPNEDEYKRKRREKNQKNDSDV